MDEETKAKLQLPGLSFTWDDTKAEENFAKHGVEFREAATVFLDPLAVYFEPEIVDAEVRDTIVGRSLRPRILLVIHTERGAITRIISARPPTPVERRRYEEG